MDRHLRAERTVIVCAVILTAAALGGGSGTSEESSDEGAPATSTLTKAAPAATDSDDVEGSSNTTAAPEGPQSDAPDSDGAGQGPGDDEGSVEVLLASVESAAVPLGDIIGAERPAGLEPVTSRADSYQGLCPAEDIPVEAVVQQDPLVENVPVERWILAFSSDDEAADFFDAQRLTEVGCVAERSTTVSVATTQVGPLEVMAEVEAFQIAALIKVDLTSQDRDPRAVDVVRSIAVEGSAIVVVSSLAEYGSVIGVADVHGPLLVDGIGLVRASG